LTGRVVGVDPGSKRIGLAVSDPEGRIAFPHSVILHSNILDDCRKIVETANSAGAWKIVIGQRTDEEGNPTGIGLHAARMAVELVSLCNLDIKLWDESFSTQAAREEKLQMMVTRKKRGGHQDALAAAVILQSYLDSLPR